jgi:hypothetical protein
MAHATNLWEHTWVKLMFGGNALSTPTISQFEVALLTDALVPPASATCPSEQPTLEPDADYSIVGSQGNEPPTGGGTGSYARQTILNTTGAGGFTHPSAPPAAGFDTVVNTDEIVFPVNDSGVNWPDINYIALIVDDPAAGLALNRRIAAYIPLDNAPLQVPDTTSVTIPAGTLKLRIA